MGVQGEMPAWSCDATQMTRCQVPCEMAWPCEMVFHAMSWSKHARCELAERPGGGQLVNLVSTCMKFVS
jgi:hypothetical protein